MPSSEQENGGSGGGVGLLPFSAAGCQAAQPTAPAAAPFRFHTPRCLIDWCALHALDLDAVVRDTDLDSLERVLDVLHGGDIEAEDPRNLTPINLVQLFRAAQLTLNYLLHVQDRLAGDSAATQREAAVLRQREQLLQLKVKEVREELAGSRKEVRHLKKSLRSFQALALARQHAPLPAQEVRVVERVVEVADCVATSKVERLEAQLSDLARERQDMQRDNSKLTDALAAAVAAQAGMESGTAKAVESARREEQEAAAERLQAALEEERRRHRDSKAKLSVVVSSSDGSPSLHSKLAQAQQREREAEQRAEAAALEAARAAASASKAAAAPLAEVRRLRTQLESVQAEADILRSRFAQMQQEHSPSGPGCRLGSSGLGEGLEDADDARIRQLEEQVGMQKAELIASEAALAQATAHCHNLQQSLQTARRQHSSTSGGLPAAAEAAERAATADVLELEVKRLRADKAALKEECRRLRQQAAQDAVEIEHLTERLKHVGAVRGCTSQPASRSVSPAKAAAANDLRSPVPKQQGQQAPPEQRGIGSPIEEAAADVTAGGHGRQHAGSHPGSARGRQRPGSPSAASTSPSPGEQPDACPLAADRRQFRREMQHTLTSAERPGVVSRFPHSLGSFLALRPDLEEELESELAAELTSYDLDPAAEQLSDCQLAEAMAELERRRGVARQAMSASDRQRMHYMRSTAAWHVQRMAELAAGERSASPTNRQHLVQVPSLKPIRTSSRDEELLSPRRRSFVEQVLNQVGDEAAIYSPLARGASVLSDRGYLDGDVTPRSSSPAGSWCPLVPDEGGAPCSPWALTHDRVFHAGLEVEGSASASPLGHAASRSRQASPAASAGASPWQHRATRSVQFSDVDGGDAAVEVHRVGRRPSFSQPAAGAAGSPTKRWRRGAGSAEDAQLPGGRRLVKQGGEAIMPAEQWDSRDWDTGEAAVVRPTAARRSMAAGG